MKQTANAGIDLDSLTLWDANIPMGYMEECADGEYVKLSDVRELIARRAEPSVAADADAYILRSKATGEKSLVWPHIAANYGEQSYDKIALTKQARAALTPPAIDQPPELTGQPSGAICQPAAVASPAVSQNAAPTAWIAYYDGVKSQNVARTLEEKAEIENIGRLMNSAAKITWEELYSHASAPAVSQKDGAAVDPVGEIVAGDAAHGWHMKAFRAWDEIGEGTLLYAGSPSTAATTASADHSEDVRDMVDWKANAECLLEEVKQYREIFKAAAMGEATTASPDVSAISMQPLCNGDVTTASASGDVTAILKGLRNPDQCDIRVLRGYMRAAADLIECPQAPSREAAEQQIGTGERAPGTDPEFMKFWHADHRPAINNILSISHVAVHYIWQAGRRAALARAPLPMDDDEATRLRRVVRALGIEKDVPQDDETLRGCLFSVLGMIARKLEGRAPLPAQGDANPVGEVIIEKDGNGVPSNTVRWLGKSPVAGSLLYAAPAQAGDAAPSAPAVAWLIEWKTEEEGGGQTIATHNCIADIRALYGNATVTELVPRAAMSASQDQKGGAA